MVRTGNVDGPVRKLIAEIGSVNGDLPFALETVERMAVAGADYVKGQLYNADTLVTRDAASYGTGLDEPATQYEAFSKALSYDDWGIVKERCDKLGVVFFGSVFDLAAVDAGVDQGWSAFKIASADITNRPLLEAVAETGRRVFLSTGASTEFEIRRAADMFTDVTVMACTLTYPCPLIEANVDRVLTLTGTYGQVVGYSDHTRGIAAADYAFRIGAEFVGKHVTITPGEAGDHAFAIDPTEVKQLVRGDAWGDDAVDALVAGDGKVGPIESESAARLLARRSPVTTTLISHGDIVDESNTIMLRPATGIDPFDLPVTAMVDMPVGTTVRSGLVK